MFRSPKLMVELSLWTVVLANLGRLASKLGSTRRQLVFLGGRRVEDQKDFIGLELSVWKFRQEPR